MLDNWIQICGSSAYTKNKRTKLQSQVTNGLRFEFVQTSHLRFEVKQTNEWQWARFGLDSLPRNQIELNQTIYIKQKSNQTV